MAFSFISLCLNRTPNTPVGHERLGQPFWPNRRTSPSSCSSEQPGCRRLAQFTGVNGCRVIFQQVPVSKHQTKTTQSAVDCFHSGVLNFYFLLFNTSRNTWRIITNDGAVTMKRCATDNYDYHYNIDSINIIIISSRSTISHTHAHNVQCVCVFLKIPDFSQTHCSWNFLMDLHL